MGLKQKMLNYSEALNLMRRNRRAVWSPKTEGDITSDYAAGRIFENFADILAPKPFRFSRKQRFFCVGSCFARELEDAIVQEGGAAETRSLSIEMIQSRPDFFEPAAGASGRPNAFLNRYNSASMNLLMEDVARGTLGNKLLYGDEVRIDYHYTRFLRSLPLDLALQRRAHILDMYRAALSNSDIFVFTLGLCEAFKDVEDEAFLNITPDPRNAVGHELEFHMLNVEDNANLIIRMIESLRTVRPDAEIVLTVSPVPLDVTFTDMDVVVANTLAKSTLVTAAHDVSNRVEGCYYFPSYEMAMLSPRENAWLWDKKHVAPRMVGHIMHAFMCNHLDGAS